MSSIYRTSTIAKLIAEGRDDAPAIGAPERTALTHKGLRQLAQRTISDLNRMGIGRNDRVAIVLPNGPEMAAAFIAIACGATTAPLNPAYRAEEFDFYLSDPGRHGQPRAGGGGSAKHSAAVAEARPGGG